jgi:NCS1 family nucleobase:cation symporter-1
MKCWKHHIATDDNGIPIAASPDWIPPSEPLFIAGRKNALAAFTVGSVVLIPFMNTPIYMGPMPRYLDSLDLSWVIGLLPTSPLYFWLASRDSVYRRGQANAIVRRHAARQS